MKHLLYCLVFVILPTFTVSAILQYSNETDRIALLEFKHRLFNDSHGVLLNSWNDSQHHCHWPGVSCSRQNQRVVALRLPDKGLVGTISPHIGNLTFLRELNLSTNKLSGQIPGEIGRLFRLRSLDLSVNALTGELLAANLSSCLQLREIFLYLNGLHGKLPAELANLKKLQSLSLDANQLTGEIPPSFGNLSSLSGLGMEYNHLEGNIPEEITRCRGLLLLSLGANNLTGTLSSAFFNMTSIINFSISENSLQGTIPNYIGDTMPNLKGFYFGVNKFHGTIPASFPNASKLQLLELSQNYFVGDVPDNIGRLKDLRRLNLQLNFLGGNDFTFMTSLSNCSDLTQFSIAGNSFEGKLPDTIANLSSKLSMLSLAGNKFSGAIPIRINNLASLIALELDDNHLSGVIPSEIGDLKNLQVLALQKNQFFGKIPLVLFNITSLSSLYMEDNNLDGYIPSSVGNLWNLNELYLSHNRLDGFIPGKIFDLPSLSKYLDLSSNSFTGPLSPAVGTKASTSGDVYSFGILLLEMFTAKRPTNDLFNGGCSTLYEYVDAALFSEQVMKIVDPLLLVCLESHNGARPYEDSDNFRNLVEIEESKTHNFFLSIFKIGLICASRSPMDRMHMNDVSRELHKIKKSFFA
nr:probable LRR receptor-like serine/threonine-protein kinase At3g47570 [Ipomoea trifida]